MGRSRTQGISLYPRLTSHTTVHGAIVPASVSNPLPPYPAPTIDPLLVLVPPPASPSACFSCFRPRLGVWSLPPPLNPLFPINPLLSPRFLAPLTISPYPLPLLISYHSASVVPVHTPSDPRFVFSVHPKSFVLAYNYIIHTCSKLVGTRAVPRCYNPSSLLIHE
ncbi:hypothetical protein PTI98_006168 [Pleurotus ostreatus]|nr:hypothetical protein PTI98_006168 [Pleurotus ostreatus]